MGQGTSSNKTGPARTLTLLVNLALYAGGVWVFINLLRATDLTWETFTRIGWHVPALMCALYGLVVLVDACAWKVAGAPAYRATARGLAVLRTGGEALTAAIPGGLVLGEAYKANMLKRWYRTPYVDSAPSLLLLKFALGYSQALFVVFALAASYGLLRDGSQALVGFEGLHWVSLGALLVMSVIMGVPLALLASGQSFAGIARWAGRIAPGLGRWLEAKSERIETLDRGCAQIMRADKKRLAVVFSFSFSRWLVQMAETFFVLHALGFAPSWKMALVVEGVGGLFRLVFFMVPSGIGGQDASFFGLFKLFHLPIAGAGVFVVLKRVRELFWIGVGFVLVAVTRHTQALGANDNLDGVGARPTTIPPV